MIMPAVIRLMPLAIFMALAACGGTGVGAPPPDPAEVAALAQTIRGLGPEVDPDEAGRAARIAHDHAHSLSVAYGVTDPPLIHNSKVNMGLRPRGLCHHWAEDMETRMRQENFRTLALHRAIANSENPLRIDHSTLIVSRRGDAMEQGVVLDPWRSGGDLFFARVAEDTDYRWQPRAQVFARKLAAAKGRQIPSAAPRKAMPPG